MDEGQEFNVLEQKVSLTAKIGAIDEWTKTQLDC
jgi:hypothetical protein